jgi:hypothetical protein
MNYQRNVTGSPVLFSVILELGQILLQLIEFERSLFSGTGALLSRSPLGRGKFFRWPQVWRIQQCLYLLSERIDILEHYVFICHKWEMNTQRSKSCVRCDNKHGLWLKNAIDDDTKKRNKIIYTCIGPMNVFVCIKTLIQMSHTKTFKITPTCFDHQLIIIRERFDPG